MQIQPLGDRVLIEAIEETEQMKGGIVIPDSAKEKPQEAKVVALGTGGVDDDEAELGRLRAKLGRRFDLRRV